MTAKTWERRQTDVLRVLMWFLLFRHYGTGGWTFCVRLHAPNQDFPLTPPSVPRGCRRPSSCACGAAPSPFDYAKGHDTFLGRDINGCLKGNMWPASTM
jgi:hypothetical protein